MITNFSKILQSIKRFFAFAGPGYLVAVGYMDPGNWVTGLAGGSRYGYALLSIILISNFMAILLQYCALKLGIVTGKDLARACRDYYHPVVSKILWILAELAIIATDLAEVIGSALGLYLLFGIPLAWGVCITIIDVLILLTFGQRNMRTIELVVTSLVGILLACFGIIIYIAQPDWLEVVGGLVPSIKILQNPDMLYLAIGIIGATVMPHNLYLHSYLVKKTDINSDHQKSESIFYSSLDLYISLAFAFLVNAAILIASAAIFYERGLYTVVEIQDAYNLFTPLLNTHVASFVFAVALLISGQNSTLTGTLAGQIVMDGFMNISIPAWQRRLLGRLLSIIPALVTLLIFGETYLSKMLIFSQIILSLQLPFAVIPLVLFTSSAGIMGKFVNSMLLKITAFMVAMAIIGINLWLIVSLNMAFV